MIVCVTNLKVPCCSDLQKRRVTVTEFPLVLITTLYDSLCAHLQRAHSATALTSVVLHLLTFTCSTLVPDERGCVSFVWGELFCHGFETDASALKEFMKEDVRRIPNMKHSQSPNRRASGDQ